MPLLAISHTGMRVDGIDEKAPKRSLLEKLGAVTASPMYRDKADGSTAKIGYVVSMGRGCSPEWFSLYNVTPWEVQS